MYKTIKMIVTLAIVLVLASCTARTVDLQTFNTPITNKLSEDKIEAVILQAAAGRGFVANSVNPGAIKLTYNARGHSATMLVKYTTTQFSINYVSSENLGSSGTKIHPRYNSWANNLNQDINVALSTTR